MIPLNDDNPTRITPFVSWTLIVMCVLVFLWEFSLGPKGMQAAVFAYGFIPATFFGQAQLPAELAVVPPPGTDKALGIFGDNVEDAMGHNRFVFFYLICGLAAAMAQALPAPRSEIPMVGASGAISGVLGAYLLLHPRAHVLVLIPLGFFTQIVKLPAMIVLGLWFALQLFQEAAAGQGAGVAFRAHIGGFVAGMLLVSIFKYRKVPLLD